LYFISLLSNVRIVHIADCKPVPGDVRMAHTKREEMSTREQEPAHISGSYSSVQELASSWECCSSVQAQALASTSDSCSSAQALANNSVQAQANNSAQALVLASSSVQERESWCKDRSKEKIQEEMALAHTPICYNPAHCDDRQHLLQTPECSTEPHTIPREMVPFPQHFQIARIYPGYLHDDLDCSSRLSCRLFHLCSPQRRSHRR